MKRVMIILIFMGALFTYDLPAQNRLQGERIEQRRSDRNQFRNGPGRGRCKKAQIRHHRKMRRMAAIDGRVTPGERRVLRNERRRVF
jgi:hypothetical protein